MSCRGEDRIVFFGFEVREEFDDGCLAKKGGELQMTAQGLEKAMPATRRLASGPDRESLGCRNCKTGVRGPIVPGF